MGPELIKKLLAVSVIIIFTFIHYRGIKYGSRIQNVLTLLKVLLIVVLLIAGFGSGNGDFQNFRDGDKALKGLSGFKTIGLSLMWIMFAYSGWNASTYLGAEIKDPVRTLPRSLIFGTGIVVLLYLLINALYIYSIKPAEMKDVFQWAACNGKSFNLQKYLSPPYRICLVLITQCFYHYRPRVLLK